VNCLIEYLSYIAEIPCTITDITETARMPERLVEDDCELRALAIEEPHERTLSKR
jgi:hypothetical protein